MIIRAVLRWNGGGGLDETSKFWLAYLDQVEARAVLASRGKMSTIRDHNTLKSTLTRTTLRGVAGPGV